MQSVTARAVYYEGPRQLRLVELPLPPIGPGELLIEVEMAGVDGSELHMYQGEFLWLNDRVPVIFGDEIVGRVAEIGADAAGARGLRVGDRVIVEARWPCDECAPCRRGQYFRCEKNPDHRYSYGLAHCGEPPYLWGGYSTHVFVPAEALVYKVPDGMPLKTALIASSVLANGIRWCDVVEAGAGSTVAVIGPGPQGLACVTAAVERGATVVAIGLEHDHERLKLAEKLGAVAGLTIAEHDGVGDTVAATRAVVGMKEAVGAVDIVIELAGPRAAKELAMALVRVSGTILNASVASPGDDQLTWSALRNREIRLLNAVSHPHAVGRSIELADSLLKRGTDIGDLVTHVLPLDRAEHALRIAGYLTEERPVKVVLDPKAAR